MRSRFAVFTLLAAGCNEVTILDHTSEREGLRAVAALEHAGIAATLTRDGEGSGANRRVLVAHSDVAHAIAVLADEAIPRRDEAGFTEVMGTRGLVSTGAEERARVAQSVAGELARTLETIDGVLDARVHVVLPERDLVAMERTTTPSASVLVVHGTTTPPIDERSVRVLVAGACEGMRPEHVSVIFSRRAPRAPRRATLAYVGPIAVAPASASTLRVLLAAMFVTITAAVALALRLRARVIR